MNNKLTVYKLQARSYKKEGYTLIEVLVAIAMFSIAITISTNFFISSFRSQNRALSIRETVDNTSHVMEYIARALRMARKDKDGSCITAGTNYEITRGGKGIKFKNYQEPSVCQELYWEVNVNDSCIYESKDGADGLPLTSSYLEVTLFQFRLLGESQSNNGQSNNEQPRVTVLLEIAKKGLSGSTFTKTRTQTTISQRNLDVMQ